MAKYYLIEAYTQDNDRGGSWNEYDIKSFDTVTQLEKVILKGPEHGGKLIPMKSSLDYKLQLIVEDDLKQGGKKSYEY